MSGRPLKDSTSRRDRYAARTTAARAFRLLRAPQPSQAPSCLARTFSTARAPRRSEGRSRARWGCSIRPRTLLAKVKQQRAGLTLSRSRGGRHFLEIEGEKEDPFDAHPAPSSALHAVVVIPMAPKPSGVTGGQLALGASDAPRDYNSSVFRTRQRHCGTAAREQFAGRHKTVARLSTVAGLASK